MQAVQSNKIVRLQKVSTFFASQTISNPPTGLSEQLTALNTAIAGAQDAAKVQTDSADYLSRQGKTVRQLREGLHKDHLLPLFHSAVALNQEIPNVLSHFKLPSTTLRESMYVAALNAIVGRAAEFQAQFIAHGAPADFVTSLSNAIATYTSTVQTREKAIQDRVKAGAAIPVALAAGVAAVRHLHAIVIRLYGNDPATLAAWNQARHLDQVGSRGRSTASGTASGSSTAVGTSVVSLSEAAASSTTTLGSVVSMTPATTATTPVARAA